MNYIIRKDNIPVMANNSGTETLDRKLKKEYPYIHDSILVEGYEIRFNDFDIFSEIVFEGKVVGFVTYSLRLGNNMTMNEIFVLPEFRGNGIFLEEINSLLMSGFNLSFNEPTRRIVEKLIDYNFAAKLTDSLVASALRFDISDEHMIYHGDFYLKIQEYLDFLSRG